MSLFHRTNSVASAPNGHQKAEQVSPMLKTIPANQGRAVVGLAGLGLMWVGAGVFWGWAAGLFALGLFIAIDAATDEFVERITLIKRGSE
jgi:hypothetical protein